jgi:hypothetical protein
MIYVDIKPEMTDGRFYAKIELSEYAIASVMEIAVTARKSDGTLLTQSLTYPPDEGFYADSPLIVDFFTLLRREYGQIVGVTINGESVYSEFDAVAGMESVRARYDDRIIANREMLRGNVVLDFQVIPTYDPKVILISDLSQWAAMYGYEAVMEAILPGYKESKLMYWSKDQVNVYNSMTFGLSCTEECKAVFTDLPDGVYSFTLKASDGTEKQRQYLKTDLLRLKIDELYITKGILCGEPEAGVKEKIQRAEFYLRAAEANMRLGNMIASNELYCRAGGIVEGC